MKKKLLFLIPMVVIAVLLFMLRATGMKVHIAVSVVGLVLLIVYTLAIALITGVVLMNVHGIAAISIIHKISAVLFAILLIVCEIQKVIKK